MVKNAVVVYRFVDGRKNAVFLAFCVLKTELLGKSRKKENLRKQYDEKNVLQFHLCISREKKGSPTFERYSNRQAFGTASLNHFRH